MTENNEKIDGKSKKLSKSEIKPLLFRVIYLSGIFMFLISMYLPWYKIDISYTGNSFSYVLYPFDGWIRNAARHADQYSIPEWNPFRLLYILISIIENLILVNNIINTKNIEYFKKRKEFYQISYYISGFISIIFLIYLFNNQLSFPLGIEEFESGNYRIIHNYSLQIGYFLCFISPLLIKIGYEGLIYMYKIKEQRFKEDFDAKQLSQISTMTSLDKLLLLRQMETNLKNNEDFKKSVKELIEL